jgi:hypothetical protein
MYMNTLRRHQLGLSLILCTIAAAIPTSAWPWGSEGHETVGAIADLRIQDQPAVRGKVDQILKGKSLSEVSIFADCAKHPKICNEDKLTEDQEDYVKHNPDHANYHFTDVPIQQKRYVAHSAGTGDDDVVGVIGYAIKVLRGPAPSNGPAHLSQAQALWVLVHLVGDVHQPLHVGAVYYDNRCNAIVDPNVVGAGLPKFGIGGIVLGTTGGNDLMITHSEELHGFWDDTAVAKAARLKNLKGPKVDPKAFAQKIVSEPPSGWQTSGDPEGWATQWASESLLLATEALSEPVFGQASVKHNHKGPDTCTAPVSIDDDYKKSAGKTALDQLGKGGFRLAALLSWIFGGGQ